MLLMSFVCFFFLASYVMMPLAVIFIHVQDATYLSV